MTHRWQVSFDDGDSWSDVTPLNAGKLRIQRKRDLDAGQIFFRKYINQGILFGKDDYPQFLAIERQASRRCNAILVRLQLKCNNNYQEDWRGKFSTGSGTFNLFECTFEVKPDTVDKYSCLLEKQDEKVNVLDTASHTVKAVTLPEGMEITFAAELPGGGTQMNELGWLQVDTQTLVSPAMGSCPETSVTHPIWWRETVVTDCLDGSPVMPAGTGWVQLFDSGVGGSPNYPTCDDEGKVKWARQPTISWPFANDPLVVGPVSGPGGTLQPPVSPSCNAWFRVGLFTCLGGYGAGIWICLNSAQSQVTISTARSLQDVANRLIENTACSMGGTARSDFFEWEPVGSAVGYIAGQNYVTGLDNTYDHLFLIQNSDMQDPDASNPATIGNMSIADLMKLLRVAFRVYWDIDASNRIRFEHWKYWTQPIGFDLQSHTKVNETLLYSHIGTIPHIERAKWAAALGLEFVGKDIVYSSPCAGSDVEESSPGSFVTDISMAISDPNSINKDGFTIVATDVDGSDFDVILDLGAISNAYVTNAPMALSNLQRDLWTSDRYLPSAIMNGVDTAFDGFLPNIEQKSVACDMCCDELSFDATKGITTALGTRLGNIPATVEDYEFEMKTGRAVMTLRYSY